MPEFNLGNASQVFGPQIQQAVGLQKFLVDRSRPDEIPEVTTTQGPNGVQHNVKVSHGVLEKIMGEFQEKSAKLDAINDAFDQQLLQQQQQRQARLAGMSPLAEVLTTVASSMGQAKDMPGWVQGLAHANAKLNPTRRELEGEAMQLGQERSKLAQQRLGEADRMFGMAAKLEDAEARRDMMAYQKEQDRLSRERVDAARREDKAEKDKLAYVQNYEKIANTFGVKGDLQKVKDMVTADPKLSDIEKRTIYASAEGAHMAHQQHLADEKRKIALQTVAFKERHAYDQQLKAQYYGERMIFNTQLKALVAQMDPRNEADQQRIMSAAVGHLGSIEKGRAGELAAVDTPLMGAPALTPAQKAQAKAEINRKWDAMKTETEEQLKLAKSKLKGPKEIKAWEASRRGVEAGYFSAVSRIANPQQKKSDGMDFSQADLDSLAKEAEERAKNKEAQNAAQRKISGQ